MSGKRTINLSGLALWLSIFTAGMGLFSTAASAAEVTRPVILGGLAFGGDTLVDTSDSDLDAGGLLYFGVGLIHVPVNSPLMYQFSLGYKFDTVNFYVPSGGTVFPGLGFIPGGTGGDSKITTWPLDAMAFYKTGNLRFGLGLTYYMNPKWETCFDYTGCSTYNFDDALGVSFELRHQWTDILFWGARYTDVEYDWGSSTADASNLRIHFGMIF
jgi:hypothetical protein